MEDAVGGEEAAMLKGWVRIKRSPITLEEVGAWAEEYGGELAVRVALAEGKFGLGRSAVESWLAIEERKRLLQNEAAALQTAERAAQASEKSARWAMWAALISAATGIVSAAAYWLARVVG